MSRYPNQQNQDFGYGDRYDRLTNYNSARSQSSTSYRASDSLYDEHYGKRGLGQERPAERRRMGAGGGGQRNMPREMNQQYRARDDRRSGGYRGGGGPDVGGLLGASPNEPAQNVSGVMGGNTTQQQLAAAMQAHQTQNLLAILQAQQLSGMSPGSLLPTPGMQQRGKGGRQFNDRNRQRQHPNQKRRGPGQDYGPGFKKRRDNSPRVPQNAPWKQNKQITPRALHQKQQKDLKPRRAEGEEDDVFELTEEEATKEFGDLESIEIPQDLVEKIEELRKRTKIDRNIADQDVDKLSAFHFDGQNYRCRLCKIVAHSYKSIKQHFMGKKHSLNVIEARQAGNDVDRDIMDIMLHPENWLELNPAAKTILKKQAIGFMEAKKKEEEEFKIRHPENFVTYRMDTRKSATKSEDSVIIRHTCESVVAVKDFAGDKQLFGVEFIKAVSGFDCRLCNKILSNGSNVVDHIRTPQHIEAYQKYLEEHQGYHENIVKKNKYIASVLDQHVDKEVILYEAFEEDSEAQQMMEMKYLNKDDPDFVRIEKSVPEWHPKDGEEQEETREEVEEEETGELKGEEQEEPGEGFDEELLDDEPLDEEAIEQGYDEEDVLDDEAKLVEDETKGEEQPEEGEIIDETEESKQEELYEPSEPTNDNETEIEPAKQPPPDQKKPLPSKKPPPKSNQSAAVAPTRPAGQSPSGRPRGRGGQRGVGRAAPRAIRGGRQSQRPTRSPRTRPGAGEEKFEVIDEVGAE